MKKTENRNSDTLLTRNLPAVENQETEEKESKTILGKFKMGFAKTRKRLITGLKQSLIGEEEIDEEIMDEIEEMLLCSDMGVSTSRKIIQRLEAEVEQGTLKTKQDIFQYIRNIIETTLNVEKREIQFQPDSPTVLMFIGVNGVGKTTSIGKLASQFQQQNKRVLIAAGDTFRAAAIEQLREWAIRANVD